MADAESRPVFGRLKTISLFSGSMGLDLGLERAGFEASVCVEIDKDCVDTIRKNRPSTPVLHADISQIRGEQLIRSGGFRTGDVPLVAGGPPCQAFSVFGRRQGIEDRRGKLIFEYLRIVSETRPHAFVMENVRGLLSMPVRPGKGEGGAKTDGTGKGSLLKKLLADFEGIGYRVDCHVVNAVNYGAPQIRERIILVGNRHNLISDFPKPMASNRPQDGLPPFRTLGDAIGKGFRDPDPEVMNFSPRKLGYLSLIPPGGNWRSLPVGLQKESMGKSWHLKGGRSAYWRKLSFSFPSPTVVTMPNHAGTSMCHPAELRTISVGEAAAIQEFPRTWRFAGTTASKYRQVGNAVPIRLGEMAGICARDLLRRVERGETGRAAEPVPSRIVHIRPHVRTRTFWKNGEAFAGDHSYYSSGRGPDTRHQTAGNN